MKYYVYNHHNFWQWENSNSDMMNAEVIFVWADWPFKDQVEILKGMGKKVIVYEHGFNSLWDYELNNREPIADGYIALGEESKKSLIRKGVDSNRILVTGNPIFDDIKKTEHKGNKALFVALHWVRDLTEYNQLMFDLLQKAYPEFDWTVKLIDKTGDIQADKKWYNDVESSDILKDIKRKLPNYDMVFTLRPSTFEAFARLMNIPVYVIDEEQSYSLSGDPVMTPINNTYLKIGDKLPEQKEINMDKHIMRPSLTIEEIGEWIETML